jgi:phosphoribosylformylglycinamidine synthase
MHAAISAGLAKSVHDLAEGGLAVAAAEWAHSGRLGVRLDVESSPEVLFGEGSGRYLVEVAPGDGDKFSAAVPAATKVGQVTGDGVVKIGELSVPLEEVTAAYVGGAS